MFPCQVAGPTNERRYMMDPEVYDEDELDFIETTEEAIRAALADRENDEAKLQ